MVYYSKKDSIDSYRDQRIFVVYCLYQNKKYDCPPSFEERGTTMNSRVVR
jgi:hypothetical protein